MTTQQSRRSQSVSYHPASQPSNRRLPEEFVAFSPLAAQYDTLMKVEQKLDATITRKRYDMQDTLSRPLKTKRTMRVWCSNTTSDQAWQESAAGVDDNNNFDFDTGSIPSWTLRIEGLLLPSAVSGTAAEDEEPKLQFTDLIRSVLIEEDRGFDGLYDEGPILDYHKPPNVPGSAVASLPGLEIKRKGDSDVQLKISMTLENMPERYKLQPALSQLLDLTEATRQEIISGLWHYVQAEKLQDTEEKRLVHTDPALKAIFNLERLFFPDLPKLINRHLLPCDPIVLEYGVRVDKEQHVAPHFWDIEVLVDAPIRMKLTSILKSFQSPNPEIFVQDQKIAALILDIEQSLAKKEFLESYCKDPSEFLKQWMASQNEDMEIMMGDVKKVSGEHARRAGYYMGDKDWLKESVFHYLAQERI